MARFNKLKSSRYRTLRVESLGKRELLAADLVVMEMEDSTSTASEVAETSSTGIDYEFTEEDYRTIEQQNFVGKLNASFGPFIPVGSDSVLRVSGHFVVANGSGISVYNADPEVRDSVRKSFYPIDEDFASVVAFGDRVLVADAPATGNGSVIKYRLFDITPDGQLVEVDHIERPVVDIGRADFDDDYSQINYEIDSRSKISGFVDNYLDITGVSAPSDDGALFLTDIYPRELNSLQSDVISVLSNESLLVVPVDNGGYLLRSGFGSEVMYHIDRNDNGDFAFRGDVQVPEDFKELTSARMVDGILHLYGALGPGSIQPLELLNGGLDYVEVVLDNKLQPIQTNVLLTGRDALLKLEQGTSREKYLSGGFQDDIDIYYSSIEEHTLRVVTTNGDQMAEQVIAVPGRSVGWYGGIALNRDTIVSFSADPDQVLDYLRRADELDLSTVHPDITAHLLRRDSDGAFQIVDSEALGDFPAAYADGRIRDGALTLESGPQALILRADDNRLVVERTSIDFAYYAENITGFLDATVYSDRSGVQIEWIEGEATDEPNSGEVVTEEPPTEPVDAVFGDASGDGFVSPIDALLVINHINRVGLNQSGEGDFDPALDTNKDGHVSPIDALIILNQISSGPASTNTLATGEANFAVPVSTANRSELDDDRDSESTLEELTPS